MAVLVAVLRPLLCLALILLAPIAGWHRIWGCALAAGLSNQEIGQKLYITLGAAKTHVSSIYHKLDSTAYASHRALRSSPLGERSTAMQPASRQGEARGEAQIG